MIKIEKPKIKYLDEETFIESLENEEFYGKSFSESPVKKIAFVNRIFECCVFDHIDFSNVDFVDCDFIDCRFTNCILLNKSFASHALQRVVFSSCKLLGCDFSSSYLKDVTFFSSTGQYLNFSMTEFISVEMKKSSFIESTFEYIKSRDVFVDHSDFSKSRFINANLELWDFTTSEISGCGFDNVSLKGMIVSEIQALSLARLLGIVIK